MTRGNGKQQIFAEECEKQLVAMRLQQNENDRKMAVIIAKLETVAEKLANLPCLNIQQKG